MSSIPKPIPKQKTKEKTIKNNKSITFRIDKYFLDELHKEAEQKMDTVNTLVNQILKSYITWHKPAKKARIVYVSKDLMAKSMEHLTDKQVIQMTKEFCSKQMEDIIHMLRDENTFASFMDAICTWLDESGFNYRIERNSDSDSDVYIIQFDMGKNWSLYFKTQMEFVFEHYNIENAEAEMANNTVILKIKREQ